MNETPGKAQRGSQRWLQEAVNRRPELIDSQVNAALDLPATNALLWASPLERDHFVEYRDHEALKRLDITLQKRPLEEFWPPRGPVWDGLARASNGEVLLVEAKAHVAEIASPRSSAGDDSLTLIASSLHKLQDFLGIDPNRYNWTGTFYQYANRLAFLYLLRILNDIPARLVFVYFLNDTERSGPATRQEWEAALRVLYAALGLPKRHKLSKYVTNVFINVRQIVSSEPATLQRALEIAILAHAGETDRKVRGREPTGHERQNSPYVLHPLRMMLRLEFLKDRIAAVLHDVVEDTDWTLEQLREEGFSEEVLAAVDALTQRENEPYEESFIPRVLENPIARRVKLADIEDNMNLTRIENPESKDLHRLEKYRRAWARLKAEVDSA